MAGKSKTQKQKQKARAQERKQSAPIYESTQEKSGPELLMEEDFQRQTEARKAGREEPLYGIGKAIWPFMQWYDSKRVPHTFKKKTYMWLMLFTGFVGGHRWYQGRRILGFIETCLCWTGIPMLLLVTDFMEVYPIKPDENGYITMR